MKPSSVRQPFRSRAARAEAKLDALVTGRGGQDFLEIVAQRYGETGMRYAQLTEVCACDQAPWRRFHNSRSQENDALTKYIEEIESFQDAQTVALDADGAAHALEASRLFVHRAGKASALGRYGSNEPSRAASNDCNPWFARHRRIHSRVVPHRPSGQSTRLANE